MNEAAPAALRALEGSGLGQAIRESVWAYPTANVIHVVAVTAFVSSVVVMDLALLGRLGEAQRACIARSARRAAMGLFLLVAASGFVLFTAEASHVALNPVFLGKMALILLALGNAFLARPAVAAMDGGAGQPPPSAGRLQLAAVVSLVVWFTVVAAGRLIAYF